MPFFKYNPNTDEPDIYSGFEVLDTEPETAAEGDAYIDTVKAALMVFFAGTWQIMAQFGGYNYLATEEGDTLVTEAGEGIYI